MADFYVRDSPVTIWFPGSLFYTLILYPPRQVTAGNRSAFVGYVQLGSIKGIKQYLRFQNRPGVKASFIFSAPSCTSSDSSHKIVYITMILCLIQSIYT